MSGAFFDTAERWTHLAIGLAVFMHRHSEATYRAVADEENPTRAGFGNAAAEAPGIAALIPGAVMGLALTTQQSIFDRVAGLEGRMQLLTRRVTGRQPLGPILDRVRAFLAQWDERYRAEAEDHGAVATDYLARLAPDALDALLVRIDVEALLDHVDVNSAVDRVDLDLLIDKVPVDRVIDRIDLRSVVLDTVAQVQVTDILRESTGAMATRLSGGRIRLT
ncbi:MAG: hypothetical protein Q8P61_06085 [Candidatus Nanopelagicales bacterium]|nr:hypothetical protein [Candidatus Nanopelagicales bacterium]